MSLVKTFPIVLLTLIAAACSGGSAQSPSSAEPSTDTAAAEAALSEDRYHQSAIDNNLISGVWDISYRFPDGRLKSAYSSIPAIGNSVTIYSYEGDSFGPGADCYNTVNFPITTTNGQGIHTNTAGTTEWLINGVRYSMYRTEYELLEVVSQDVADLDLDGDITEYATETYTLIEGDDARNLLRDLKAKACP